jgi:OHCU decarboxylase
VPSDPRQADGVGRLEWFNALTRTAALEQLLSICSSRRWAEAMVDARPFDDLASLQEKADSVWLALGPEDWLQALEGHPRIGEKGGAAEDHSRQEQAGMQKASVSVRDAIADGNRRYEERFGHVFLIAASGREPQEILANLTRRLDNDPDDELRIAAQEHRRITRLRLDRMFA